MDHSKRHYDVVLLGATGYTGHYVADYMTRTSPPSSRSDFKWAIAGRSSRKLAEVRTSLENLYPKKKKQQSLPSIEVLELDSCSLDALTQRTRVLINTIGPYTAYGTCVIGSCVRNRTHYLDTTEEVPWVRDVIAQFDEAARAQRTIIIPQGGFISAGADLLVYSMAVAAREDGVGPLQSVTASMRDLKVSFSNGTLSTYVTMWEHYGYRVMAWIGGPPSSFTTTSVFPTIVRVARRLCTFQSIAGHGLVVTSLPGISNEFIVLRSATILKSIYSETFSYREYLAAKNRFQGALAWATLMLRLIILLVPPLRRCLYHPSSFVSGRGPSKLEGGKDGVTLRGIAQCESRDSKQIVGELQWSGSFYELTAILLAESARTILCADSTLAHRIGGGVLTPATLGRPLLGRMRKAGFKLDVVLKSRSEIEGKRKD